MKRLALLSILLILAPTLAFGQDESADASPDTVSYLDVHFLPDPIGGFGRLAATVRYPEIAYKAGVEGVVDVYLLIDADGKIVRDPERFRPGVLRGIGAGCDEEAYRAVTQAAYYPGAHKGEPVAVEMCISVRFELDEAIQPPLQRISASECGA